MIRALLLALLPAAASAGTWGVSVPDIVATMEVRPGWREGAEQVAALHIRLAPGWKTYWRSPGEAGIPPTFSWDGSQNLSAVRFQWPVPEVFETNGLRSIGYRDELVLPIFATAADPGRPIRLVGEMQLGVCDEVCVPYSLTIAAELPVAGGTDPVVRAALADRARTAAEAGVAGVACAVEPIRDGLRLTAAIRLPSQGAGEVVAVETGSPGVWVSQSEGRRDGGTLTASVDLVPPEARPFALDRSQIRLTVLGPGRAVDIRGCPAG
jgi:DsbC/DsbD-like thiol-disulfide interchange protein